MRTKKQSLYCQMIRLIDQCSPAFGLAYATGGVVDRVVIAAHDVVVDVIFFKKTGHSQPLFSFIFVFSTNSWHN